MRITGCRGRLLDLLVTYIGRTHVTHGLGGLARSTPDHAPGDRDDLFRGRNGHRGGLDAVTGLVDKSLAFLDARAREARYRLLVTVRQYAAEPTSPHPMVPVCSSTRSPRSRHSPAATLRHPMRTNPTALNEQAADRLPAKRDPRGDEATPCRQRDQGRPAPLVKPTSHVSPQSRLLAVDPIAHSQRTCCVRMLQFQGGLRLNGAPTSGWRPQYMRQGAFRHWLAPRDTNLSTSEAR